MAILKTTFTLMMMMAWMAMTSVVTSFAPLRPVIRPSAGAATASTISTSSQLQVSPMNLRFVSFIFGLVSFGLVWFGYGNSLGVYLSLTQCPHSHPHNNNTTNNNSNDNDTGCRK